MGFNSGFKGLTKVSQPLFHGSRRNTNHENIYGSKKKFASDERSSIAGTLLATEFISKQLLHT